MYMTVTSNSAIYLSKKSNTVCYENNITETPIKWWTFKKVCYV